jgi:hypothetical protein
MTAARTVPTNQLLNLYFGFRNLYFKVTYNHILKYLTDRLVRLAEGGKRSAYTSTLSQVHSHDILSVINGCREETIIFEDSGAPTPRALGQPGSHQPRNSVPSEVGYDTPVQDSRQTDRPTGTNLVDDTAPTIPAVITCPPVPEEILVTLSHLMVNAMYKNLCTIYSSRHTGTIPDLLQPNVDEVCAILQNFGSTYYNCAGWQNDPSLNPILFDPTFLLTLLHGVTRVRTRNYVRELEATYGNVTRHSTP